ncbi:membrane protein [Brachyspira suanatina]|uniref:Membrane protein n=1 Tax=Brachyspira suanatina TaxID=381802 RepID=A0A0G4K9N1_9SPIR|nr:BMP family ABC transporter substrate-binding protein [Brachyspira suanatina]CRF34926.1 membrane protein [Brachyspira suanatina]
MNKFLTFLIMIVFLYAASCSDIDGEESSGYEIAVIVRNIDDKSFNQSTWNGVKDYAENYGISYKYYRVPDKNVELTLNAIDIAVRMGAKLIVTPGHIFETAIYKAQYMYTNVHFILIDGKPQDGTYTDYKIAKNTVSILYAEEEAGFLAGYSIVKEGYTNLGVIGGMALPPVIRFGYGFVQGAEFAANELKIPKGNISIKYTYVGNYNNSIENQTLAESWYQSGTQVIFAPAGGAVKSVINAAEDNGGLVVGIDVDQSFESPTVITSSMKLIRESVYNAIASYYNGNFNGGKITVLGAQVKGIGLPMATSKFKVFTEDDYNIIYDSLVKKKIKVLKDTDAESIDKLPLNLVKINYIN